MKRGIKSSGKLGFTIIESLVYIFFTVIVLINGIDTFILMYKSYIEAAKLSVQYNDLQNFYINLDSIVREDDVRDILVNDDYILFSYNEKKGNLQKLIKSHEGIIVAEYIRDNVTETTNIMLEDIQELRLRQKENVIYLIIKDKEGKEFVRCI